MTDKWKGLGDELITAILARCANNVMTTDDRCEGMAALMEALGFLISSVSETDNECKMRIRAIGEIMEFDVMRRRKRIKGTINV